MSHELGSQVIEADRAVTSVEAPTTPRSENHEALANALSRLSSLSVMEYEYVRDATAKALGVRVSVLDTEVSKRHDENRPAGESRDLFPQIAPWPDPVCAVELLNEIETTIHRFIVCDRDTAVSAALWCTFTWFIEYVQVAPIALITAPDKRCGKSLMLDLLHRLSRRALVSSNISPAAVFRVIEAHAPTLFIDEADTFLRDNEALRGVFNSGHTRASAYVIRTVGDDHMPQQFSTWGAKAIAGIGKLPATIMDRAIVLELRRKLPSESREQLRYTEPTLFGTLTRKLARLAKDHGARVQRARPSLPKALNDRAQDNWEPLFAISESVGGHWPGKARTAALKLSHAAAEDTQSTSAQLLEDIQDVFQKKTADKISTAALITALCSDEELGWSTYNRGRPITPKQLANKLKEYGIHSKNLAFGLSDRPKGYMRSWFADAFERYIGSVVPPSSATAATTSIHAGFKVAEEISVTATKDSPLPEEAHGCSSVAGSGVERALARELHRVMV